MRWPDAVAGSCVGVVSCLVVVFDGCCFCVIVGFGLLLASGLVADWFWGGEPGAFGFWICGFAGFGFWICWLWVLVPVELVAPPGYFVLGGLVQYGFVV